MHDGLRPADAVRPRGATSSTPSSSPSTTTSPATFNIVGDGVLPYSTVLAMMGKLPLPMPHFLARPLAPALWATQLVDSPPDVPRLPALPLRRRRRPSARARHRLRAALRHQARRSSTSSASRRRARSPGGPSRAGDHQRGQVVGHDQSPRRQSLRARRRPCRTRNRIRARARARARARRTGTDTARVRTRIERPTPSPPDEALDDIFYGEETSPPPGDYGPGLDARKEIPYTRSITDEVRELERRVRARLAPAFPHRAAPQAAARVPVAALARAGDARPLRRRRRVRPRSARTPRASSRCSSSSTRRYFRVERAGLEQHPRRRARAPRRQPLGHAALRRRDDDARRAHASTRRAATCARSSRTSSSTSPTSARS